MLLIVGSSHARVHIFHLKYECVCFCGMSLGCINTTISNGILQVLWECEAPLYNKKEKKKKTASHLHSLELSQLLLDPKFFGISPADALTENTVTFSQGLSVSNRCNERHDSNFQNTHLTWECLLKTWRCTAWCILGQMVAVMNHCSRLGTCKVKYVVVSWYSGYQTIRSRYCHKGLNLFLEGLFV